MNSFILSDQICRICLAGNNLFDWNEEISVFCGMTYKDCYHKYLQLDGTGADLLCTLNSDYYPKKLCEKCVQELKNAYFLFERAMESLNVLQSSLSDGTLITESCDVKRYETCSELTALTESTSPTIMGDIESIAESENEIDSEMLNEPTSIIGALSIRPSSEHYSSLSISHEERTVEKRTTRQSELKISLAQNRSRHFETKAPVASTSPPSRKRKKNILICQYCSFQVNGNRQLKQHEATHSENRERSETCTKCSVKFYTKEGLREHMRTHDENRQKKHKCEFCEKAFFNKGALNVHRRVHLGLMLKCNLCSKEYFRQIDLNKHLLKHSASPTQKFVGVKKYVIQCQQCKKSVFTNKLKEHMACHADKPQMKCKICDKPFFTRKNCSNHLRRKHRKISSEYKDFIHFYVKSSNTRASLLKYRLEGRVQPFINDDL